MKILLTILCLCCLTSVAQAELLPREFFDGIQPETFDAYPDWAWEQRDYDFGPFSIAGWYDTVAYYIPIAPPVEIPTIGADNLSITMHPACPAVGFDLGTVDWGESTITFYGEEGGNEVMLASFVVGDIMEQGSGPVGYQGFVGFRDDAGRPVTRFTVGPWDLYLDNVFAGDGSIAVEPASWDSVKSLYR